MKSWSARVAITGAAIVSAALFACRGERAPDRSSRPALESAVVPLDSSSAAAEQAAADDADSQGAYDSAGVLFARIAARAAAAHDTLRQARSTTQAGLAAWRSGRYADARALGERALSLKIAAGLTRELAKSYNALGLLAHNEGRFSQAIDAFARSEETAMAAGDSVALFKARGNVGLVYSDIGDFPRARTAIMALRDWASAHDETQLHGNALVNLGMVEIRAGSPATALPLLTDALRLEREAEFAVGVENALGQIGTAYQAMGEPRLAISYLDSALAIARQHGLRQPETDDLQLIAQQYGAIGNHARAIEFLARAAPLADSLGMRNIQGDIARAQARAFFALGDVRGARQRAEAARRHHRDAGSTLEQMLDELTIAELGRIEGDTAGLEVERTALASARSLASTIDSPIARIELALGEARVAAVANNPRDVLKATARARRERSVSSTASDWELSALDARAALALGDLDNAVRAGRDALTKVERVRSRLGSGSLRASFTAERSAVYADLVIALLRRGDVAEAFRIADAARSRALLEHLSAARRDSPARSPAAGLATSEQLLRRIDQLVELLRVADTVSSRRNGADDQKGFLAQQLAESRREYETLLARSAAGNERSVAILRGDLPDAQLVRAALRPGEAMLEYFATGTRLITFVVSVRGIRALDQPIAEDALASRIRLARELLGRRDSPRASRDPVMSGLYELLIAPARRAGMLEGINTLAIVPHAALAYLPFASLVDTSTGEYLVDRFDILALPSAASLAVIRAGNSPPTAQPVVNVFAPFPVSLPGSRVEMEAVSRSTRVSQRYLDTAATEHMLRASLGEERIVHVATHGVLNAQSPMFSRMELVRPRGKTPPTSNDGRLEVHEVLDLTIRSSLVFLSGCETGSGAAWSTSFMRGEDYATLAEAFLYAGARNVVSTLWRIEDRGAAAFASAYYTALRAGDPVSALAKAQRTMRASKMYSHPYYWAAFILSGDGRAFAPQKAPVLSVQ